MRGLGFALLLWFLPLHAKTMIFLVPGASHGYAPASWYLPGGEFYETLAQKGYQVHPFPWANGVFLGTSHFELFQGALKLAERILEQRKDYPEDTIHVVAHSLGANVVNLATQLLEMAQQDPELSLSDYNPNAWYPYTVKNMVQYGLSSMVHIIPVCVGTVSTLLSFPYSLNNAQFLRQVKTLKNSLFPFEKTGILMEKIPSLYPRFNPKQEAFLIIKKAFYLADIRFYFTPALSVVGQLHRFNSSLDSLQQLFQDDPEFLPINQEKIIEEQVFLSHKAFTEKEMVEKLEERF